MVERIEGRPREQSTNLVIDLLRSCGGIRRLRRWQGLARELRQQSPRASRPTQQIFRAIGTCVLAGAASPVNGVDAVDVRYESAPSGEVHATPNREKRPVFDGAEAPRRRPCRAQAAREYFGELNRARTLHLQMPHANSRLRGPPRRPCSWHHTCRRGGRRNSHQRANAVFGHRLARRLGRYSVVNETASM